MAKLDSYKGSVDLISGLRPKNNGDFPLMQAHDIQVDEDGTRLDEKLENMGGAGIYEVSSPDEISADAPDGFYVVPNEGSGESEDEPLVVTFTPTDDIFASCDKTWEEVKTALASGRALRFLFVPSDLSDTENTDESEYISVSTRYDYRLDEVFSEAMGDFSELDVFFSVKDPDSSVYYKEIVVRRLGNAFSYVREPYQYMKDYVVPTFNLIDMGVPAIIDQEVGTECDTEKLQEFCAALGKGCVKVVYDIGIPGYTLESIVGASKSLNAEVGLGYQLCILGVMGAAPIFVSINVSEINIVTSFANLVKN